MSNHPALANIRKIIPGMSAMSVMSVYPHEVCALARMYSWHWVANWLWESGVLSQRTKGPLLAGSLRVQFCLAKRKLKIKEERVIELVNAYSSYSLDDVDIAIRKGVEQSVDYDASSGKRQFINAEPIKKTLGVHVNFQANSIAGIPRDQNGKLVPGQYWRTAPPPPIQTSVELPPATRKMKPQPIQGGPEYSS